MEKVVDKTVDGDREEAAVATCDFTADDEKPWEITVPKGSRLTVLESKKKWWKVELNGRLGYVPSKILEPLIPVVTPGTQTVQVGSNQDLETGQIEPQQLELINRNAIDDEGMSVEEPNVRPAEETPRRSARLAEAAPAKKSKLDLSWKAALERGEQNNSAISDVFQAIRNGGATPRGPSDIIKAPGGLNKILIFPDFPLKIEKIEPPEDENKKSPSSSKGVSCTDSSDESCHELETRYVTEEGDLKDFPNDMFTTSCAEVELAESPRQAFALHGGLVSPTLSVESMLSISHETPTSPLPIPSSSEESNSSCSPVGPNIIMVSEPDPTAKTVIPSPNSVGSSNLISVVTSESEPVSFTQTLDNSTNPCCVLFAKVWKVLGLMYDPVPEDGKRKTTSNTVLNLRLVCNDWRTGVDNFYENISRDINDPIFKLKAHILQKRKLSLFTRSNDLDFDRYVPTIWQAYSFNCSCKIDRFLNHFKDTHSLLEPLHVQRKGMEEKVFLYHEKTNKNPVLGRFIWFSGGVTNEALDEKFESGVSELLTKYGAHIWYCRISLDETNHVKRHTRSVLEWLQSMPNLKHFTWEIKFQEGGHLSSNVFPQMKHLKRLHIEVPRPIACQFLLCNYHIDTLVSTKKLFLDSVHLLNLKELNLTIYTDNIFREFEMLKQHWPLVERIQLSFMMIDTSISWRRAMIILERWKNTLTHVSIYLPGSPSLKSIANIKSYALRRLPYRLDLPRVKYLKINFANGCVSLNRDTSLDFLLPMRDSLECLDLEYATEFEYAYPVVPCRKFSFENSWILRSNNQIPFYFGYNSNAWNVFLKLKQVCLNHFRIYSREEQYFTHKSVERENSGSPLLLPKEGGYEMGDCYYRAVWLPEFYESPVREFERAATSLCSAWKSLSNTDVDLHRESELKRSYVILISELASEGKYTSFGIYKRFNATSYRDTGKCMLCPDEPCVNGEKAVEDHFWKTHFLYAGTYKCDFMGCNEMFSCKYDVVLHRTTHGLKHMRLLYQLEAIPVHYRPLLEMAQIFNWIHVDSPQMSVEELHMLPSSSGVWN